MTRPSLPLIMSLVLTAWLTPLHASVHPGSEAFVARAASEFGLDPAEVESLLSRAEYKQSIVDAMTRPAESKPWHEYRPIFITDRRISGGIEFWRENHALIESVSAQYGVDPQIIVAIIGVETFYGRITGNYRVIDALATLGFYYPQELKRDRSEFFSTEFMHFIKLAKEENLPPEEVTGSYAGAMGMGQFIPSSYRAYAVDFDGNGSRDLWRSTADVVGSVANYLHQHGWQPGEPVVDRARALPAADPGLAEGRDFKPRLNVGELAQKGYHGSAELDPQRKAAVLKLDEGGHESYWLTFDNFYVITRYNRSPLYAMAVLQLSDAILEGMNH